MKEVPTKIYKLESDSYRISYDGPQGENVFNKLVKSLRTYNMMAFKDFYFNFSVNLRQGNLLGVSLGDNTYEYYLPCNKVFEKAYGKLRVIYKVEDKDITLITIEPKNLLNEGACRMLSVYKGVIVSSKADKFKIDMAIAQLNMKGR